MVQRGSPLIHIRVVIVIGQIAEEGIRIAVGHRTDDAGQRVGNLQVAVNNPGGWVGLLLLQDDGSCIVALATDRQNELS